MPDLIPISTLNDFIFCPYSIYLHNVYMETDEDNYYAIPQTRGKNAHKAVDEKASSTIRLQYSVYEFNNTKRMIENIKENITHKFFKLFTPDDSVVIFDVNIEKTIKYGNAIQIGRAHV